MSITVPLEGFGGGGNPLNFNVVGGTSAPASPKENTIWVNTDVEITGWHFDAEDISGQIDISNAVNATDVVAGLSNGEIHFKGDVPIAWSSTYIAKCRLIAGVTYILAANLVYGRLNIVKDPKDTGDNIVDFVERHGCGSILSFGKNHVEITPIVTSDYYLSFCSDQARADGTRPAFSTGILLYPKNVNLWIQTGANSPVEFNALKKNGIQVYPLSAKQYVGGTWVDKEAKTYQDGAWVDWWNGELFKDGNRYTDITGGWGESGYYYYSSNYQTVAPEIGNTIKLTANGYNHCCVAGTQKPVDLTNAKTLYLDVLSTVGSCYVCIVDGNKNVYSDKWIAGRTLAVGTIALDVTSVSGNVYIAVFAVEGDNATNTAEVNNIRWE